MQPWRSLFPRYTHCDDNWIRPRQNVIAYTWPSVCSRCLSQPLRSCTQFCVLYIMAVLFHIAPASLPRLLYGFHLPTSLPAIRQDGDAGPAFPSTPSANRPQRRAPLPSTRLSPHTQPLPAEAGRFKLRLKSRFRLKPALCG